MFVSYHDSEFRCRDIRACNGIRTREHRSHLVDRCKRRTTSSRLRRSRIDSSSSTAIPVSRLKKTNNIIKQFNHEIFDHFETLPCEAVVWSVAQSLHVVCRSRSWKVPLGQN
jgi:hypothetical protein